MEYFRGLERTDYQDVLRAVGLYLDEEGLRSVRILEVEEGLLVQGVPADSSSAIPQVHSRVLRTEDLRRLMEAAYHRRGSARRGSTSGP